MPYTEIKIPFTKALREMSALELRRYQEWFLGSIPNRIAILHEVVCESPGYEHWPAPFQPGSLDMLDTWFRNQVETRKSTKRELLAEKQRAPFPCDVSEQTLTDRTVSLVMDIGMYFGQLLKSEFPSLQWSQIVKDKRHADYGHAVLMGFGRIPLNPIRIAHTRANAIANHQENSRTLLQIHDYWTKFV